MCVEEGDSEVGNGSNVCSERDNNLVRCRSSV